MYFYFTWSMDQSSFSTKLKNRWTNITFFFSQFNSIDSEAVSCLLTFEHLLIMCQNPEVNSQVSEQISVSNNISPDYQSKIYSSLLGCSTPDIASIAQSSPQSERIKTICFPNANRRLFYFQLYSNSWIFWIKTITTLLNSLILQMNYFLNFWFPKYKLFMTEK